MDQLRAMRVLARVAEWPGGALPGRTPSRPLVRGLQARCRPSLRSVGTFPCNQLAAEFFGGGGHLNASGGEFYGTMEEAEKVFEQALEKYKPLLLK